LLTLGDALLVIAGFIAWGVVAHRAATRGGRGRYEALTTPELANVVRTSLFVLQRADPAATRIERRLEAGEYHRLLDSWEGFRRGAVRSVADDDRDGYVSMSDALDHLHSMLAELTARPSRPTSRRR
jgi:hypothetical protein